MPANAEYNANVTFNSSEPDLAKIKSPPTPLMSLSQSPGSSTTTSFTMNDLLVDIPNQQDNMTTEALGPSPTAYFDDEPTPRRRSNSTTRITRSVAASYDNTEDRGNSAKSIQSGRKRRIVFEGDDAEDRRKKFLERNRVAAYKCRQKKKNWMQDLEQKAELQNNQNEELRKLVAMLKEESMYLRNLLLTHGNCDCDSVQAYLRKQSAEITNNIVPSRRNSSEFSTMPSFSISPFTSSSATAAMPSLNEQSTGLTPFLDTVVNKGPQDPTDYFSTSHTEA
ncbi:hypothetical protein BD408DRAFT_338766 [Parasitella parasitica]|nr:hypothetical protein BD408DRAFT_338766 [Parasitella parasitica]